MKDSLSNGYITVMLIIILFITCDSTILSIIPKDINYPVSNSMNLKNNDNTISLQYYNATYHNPINISGRQSLLTMASEEGWPGNGSLTEPFIIEKYYFNNSAVGLGSETIFINNTEDHIIIRNCIIDSNGFDFGMSLSNTKNIIIDSCKFYGKHYCNGLKLTNCEKISLKNNNISIFNEGIVITNSSAINIFSNYLGDVYYPINIYKSFNCNINNNKVVSGYRGILLQDVNYNLIDNNSISSFHGKGIEIEGSSNVVVKKNNLSDNDETALKCKNSVSINISQNLIFHNENGINLFKTIYSNIMNNSIFLNNYRGLIIYDGGMNNIENNLFGNNDNTGLFIHNSISNSIIHNDFVNNSFNRNQPYLLPVRQANSDGENYNNFNSNFWSDWLSPDINDDGIVDVPYQIDGTEGAVDYYPRAYPWYFTNRIISYPSITSPKNKDTLRDEVEIHWIRSVDTYNNSINYTVSMTNYSDQSIQQPLQWIILREGILDNKISFDTTLIPDGNYLLRVTSFTSDGIIRNSGTIEVKIENHYLTPFQILQPTNGSVVNGLFKVKWTESFDSYGHGVFYSIYLSSFRGIGWFSITNTSTNYCIISSINYENGENYKIKIIARCYKGKTAETESNGTFIINNQVSYSQTRIQFERVTILVATVTTIVVIRQITTKIAHKRKWKSKKQLKVSTMKE